VLLDLEGDAPPRVLHQVAWPAFFVAPQFLAGGRVGFVQMASTGGAPSVWDQSTDGSPPRLLVDDAGGGFQSADGRWITLGIYPPHDPGGTGLRLRRLDARGLPTGPPRIVPGPRPIANNRFHPGTGELLVVDRIELAAIDPTTLARRSLVRWPPGTRDVERCVGHPDGRIACALSVGRAALLLVSAP